MLFIPARRGLRRIRCARFSQRVPAEQLVTAGVLASMVYTLLAVWEKGRLSFFPVTLIAGLVSFLFRVFAVGQHWPSVVPVKNTAPSAVHTSPGA